MQIQIVNDSIYNSRNYQRALAQTNALGMTTIYNSRNYQRALAAIGEYQGAVIYNSRNYQRALAKAVGKGGR